MVDLGFGVLEEKPQRDYGAPGVVVKLHDTFSTPLMIIDMLITSFTFIPPLVFEPEELPRPVS